MFEKRRHETQEKIEKEREIRRKDVSLTLDSTPRSPYQETAEARDYTVTWLSEAGNPRKYNRNKERLKRKRGFFNDSVRNKRNY